MTTLQQQAEALYRSLTCASMREQYHDPDSDVADILAFAEQIQAQERARCAGIAEQYEDKWWNAYKHGNADDRADQYVAGKSDGASDIAQAIRREDPS